ncbi:IclR family transcriptional regulator [Amycolatopsis acidiphila]|uniref:Glycerol operon regulatory protein n=1 Tax=Amycolatopsis acidiphila TaxID=715473 RepID=A0A558A4R3_9PSEU|nr:IclR family transcriptional regulator [Amycolatopsis acidiphila]TVT19259.1 IclR family transcriptional regulator [Amycolatopsis acidiphila]UIJ62315.1 IclR family transcriptional regulator [Amycolatopsis acidiphila]GHG96829.1 IclR family transcriptional regulator [Amycolatopsis acidiphila]
MTEPAGAAAEPAGVKSARRTVELLETFAAQGAWLSLSDLHAKTGFPRSSLHGLLRTLYEAGWLEADPGSARYRLGVRALICGTAYLDRDPAIPFATEALESVRERTGFTAHYARRDGAEVVYLETRESRHSTHLVSRVGRTLPAHATALGKALLAELTQDEIAALLPAELPALTPRTITSLEGLLAECEATRRRGFGAEVEEGTRGVRCVAAVVPYRIPGTDAMSCSIPVGEITDAEAKHVGELLAETAADLGGQLRRAGIR